MKKILRIPLLLVALLLSSIPISAHDFEVDGIYYNITSSTDKTVAVSFRGDKWNSYSNEYTGSVVIPEAVTYSGTTYSVTSIGDYAFYNCDGLTSVTIPNSVTSIGDYAFYNCDGLTSVTIPNSVTSIGSYAFSGCKGLTSVTIPNSVTEIGSYAFNDCDGLTEVNITDLSAWCKINFNGADSNPLGYAHKLKLNSTVVTDLIIPSDITEIKGFAFYGCTSLTSATIPNSVTSIGSSAFYGCTSLTSATIPKSVISIGTSAFNGCTGLTSIKVESGNAIYDSRENCNAIIETASNTLIICCKNTIIPNSVTSIGSSAFYGCTSLTSVTIPSSVTSIGNGAFRGCTGLTSIKVESGNSIYDSRENCNAIIETATNTLISGCKNTVIPSSVTSIGTSAFNGCTGLTEIIIPNSVDVIGNYVFNGCVGLKNVVIKDGSTTLSVGKYSNLSIQTTAPGHNHGYNNTPNIFQDCPLEKIYVGRNTTSEGFPICFKQRRLKSVQFGENVTIIPAHFFLGCDSITCIEIPNSVTSIGSAAFYDCENLSSIYISNSIESMDCHVFSGCSNLANIYVRNPVPPVLNYSLDCYTATLYVPFGAVEAYQSAKYWSNFTNIVEENPSINGLKYSKISDTEVKVIGVTESINNATIPSTITINNKTYTVTEIAGSAFYERPGLTSVTIPNSVTTIGDYAFCWCTGLTSVSIPNSVTSIGDGAFACCYGLTTVNFNATNCTTMGSSSYLVFNDCTAFTTLNIGDNVTNIPSSAFSGCTGLTSVTIPNSVTKIGNSAFKGCTGLTTVNFNATNCTTMGSSNYPVFSGCTAFTTLNIGDNVTNIPSYAFYRCTGLTSVTIGNSVTTIGDYAFNGCNKISSLSIPSLVTNIGTNAFSNCSNLASLSGGGNLQTIGSNAFWGCNKLANSSSSVTQKTATIRLTTPTQYNTGLYYSDSDKKQAEGGAVVFTGLNPNTTISKYDLALIINDIYCPIKDFSFTTRSFSASVTGSATTTSVSAIGSYTDGDMTILGEGINYGSSVTNYDGNNTITVSNLDPNRSYTIYYAVKTQEGGVYSASKSFTTSSLTWSNGGFTATSTTSARLSVETNCDATMGTGYEWKRYDAPESLAPNKAPCPVVDGMLIGSLRNLNPEVYYKCRPYYTSSSGTTYYGEWITFFTGDANVYFEPEVRTFSERSVVNNSVTVRGYALPGTDDISEQGFEYWKVPASRATSTVMTVKASGISMTATLADLEYNSTYRYRAYVKTAQGTFYGAEEEFSTGEDPAGIEYIEVDDSNNFDVMLRENPATATAWVKVAGTSAIEAEYYILTTNGGLVAKGFIPADGEYQPIELNIANGLYLMTVTDGSHRKTLRLIVR